MKHLVRKNEGAAALEFALCMPALFIAILGVIEFGRCMTFGSSCDATTAAAASGYHFDSSVFTLTPGADCGTGAGKGNLVNATFPFDFKILFYSYNLTLTAKACYPNITN
jgi:hypothetical protein